MICLNVNGNLGPIVCEKGVSRLQSYAVTNTSSFPRNFCLRLQRLNMDERALYNTSYIGFHKENAYFDLFLLLAGFTLEASSNFISTGRP